MKNRLIILIFFLSAFFANVHSQQIASPNDVCSNIPEQQAKIDTTLLQQTMFFTEKERPSYHIKKAGANIGAAVGITVFGGLATGLLAAVPAINKTSSLNKNNEAMTYAYIIGGATIITSIICTIIAGSELQTAGKMMEKIQINQNGVTVNF